MNAYDVHKQNRTDRLVTFHATNERPHWQRWHSRLAIHSGGGRCHETNQATSDYSYCAYLRDLET